MYGCPFHHHQSHTIYTHSLILLNHQIVLFFPPSLSFTQSPFSPFPLFGLCLRSSTPIHLKHNRLVSVQKHSSLGIPPHSRGQHLRLNRGSLLRQLLGVHAVVHSGDALLDNGALVEVGRDDVGSGADDLDAAVKGLVVGLGTDEAGQEAVVDY